MIRWEEVTNVYSINLETVLKIYDQSFAIEVREPHDVFLKGLQMATTMLPSTFRLVIGFDGDELISFATGHYLANVNTGFVVYIATNPLARSEGFGSLTLLKMEELLNNDSLLAGNDSLRAMILETETEELAHTEIEKEDNIKRNRFFQRNGYKHFEDIKYLQPPLHEDGNDIPLNLLIKTLQSVEINREEVIRMIRAMYHEKYDQVNGIDQQVLLKSFNKMGIDVDSI